MSLTKHYGFIHQTVIVIVLSLIRICYLSKFGKFGRCQMGKVSFTNEVVIAISSHQKKKKNTSRSNHRVRDMDKLHFKVWKAVLYC